MTPQELGKSLRFGLVADRGTDIERAFADAYGIANATDDPNAVMTAIHLVVNTIANKLIEMEV